MKSKRLLWQIFPSYLLITLFALIAITWYASDSIKQFYYAQVNENLKSSAYMMQDQILESYKSGDPDALNQLCQSLSQSGNRRITIIERSGNVIAETQEDPGQMEDHSDRPEFIEALEENFGSNIRPSGTLGQEMMYVAIPLKKDGKTVAVLRNAKFVDDINDQFQSLYKKIFAGGLVIALASSLLSLLVSRKISKPLENLKKGADRFADGDLNHELPTGNCREIDSVAAAMNIMAKEIDERIITIRRQRNEQKAVLSSMSEAVLAFDNSSRLITLNDSAADILGIDISNAKRKLIQEIVRNPSLQQFIISSLESATPAEKNLTLHKKKIEYSLQAKSSTLKDENGQKLGILVVLNDITRIRKLEQVRKDFVANVSHELKTPITSIKGFVETLLEGAINEPEQAKRFLEIISKHSDRMNAIIDDLLELSKIEQQAGKIQIELENAALKKVLEDAVIFCGERAKSKKIAIELNCQNNLHANINKPLFEEALVNLLDNAIKYSPENKKVKVSAINNNSKICISVSDYGCGIDKESQSRIFERFFRVDKGRSRKHGGTGLGLSIVKHIVESHNGTIEVHSSIGKGSKFTIKLPV